MSEGKQQVSAASRWVRDLVIIAVLAVLVFVVAGYLDILERAVSFAHQHEEWEIDEIIVVGVFLVFCFAWYSYRRAREMFVARNRLAQRAADLQKAMSEIRRLEGILPICMSCKKIRDDGGYWHNVELYIEEHAAVDISHGLCPNCAVKLYPDLAEELDSSDQED